MSEKNEHTNQGNGSKYIRSLIGIATLRSANTTRAKNQHVTWEQLCTKLNDPMVTTETYSQFMEWSKSSDRKIKQKASTAKDVGAFIGGEVRDNRRKKEHIENRSLITLDVDFANENWGFITDICLEGIRYFAHTTHSHSPEAPRWRMVFPLSRTLSTEEYEPVARGLANMVGMDYFDDTTFQYQRIMFYPSVSSDGVFEKRQEEGSSVDVDAILDGYAAEGKDWEDSRHWPYSSRDIERRSSQVVVSRREGDAPLDGPFEKPGIIGAFCRTFPISLCIDTFLPDVFVAEKSYGKEQRYTYAAGTVSGGAVVYDDDQILFVNNDTCVSRGRNNSFDLIQKHMFGHLDHGTDAFIESDMPSFEATMSFAKEQKGVLTNMAAFDGTAEDINVAPNDTRRPRIVNHHELEIALRFPDWLIKDVMETESIGMMFGDGGSYKSFLALDMAYCIASGRDWYGKPVKQGPVVYVAGEGYGGLKARLAALKRGKDVPPEEVVPLGLTSIPYAFTNGDSVTELVEDIDDMLDTPLPNTPAFDTPRLIVIDTLARNFGDGDENSTKDMSRFVANVDVVLRARFPDTTILIVHHSTGERARGNRALGLATQFVYRVSRPSERPEGTMLLENVRMKEGPEGGRMWFESVSHILMLNEETGEELTSLSLREIDEPVVEVSMPELKEHEKEELEFITDLIPENDGLNITYIADEMTEAGLVGSSRVGSRHISKLCEMGYLRKERKVKEIMILTEYF